MPLLDVQDLHVQFDTSRGVVHAVAGSSYSVRRGWSRLWAIRLRQVGLLARHHGALVQARRRVTAGRILFEGRDLLTLSAEEMREIRGRDISMIFREPMTSLNPVLSIGEQIMEPCSSI
jgi:peptide/nickel transport system ATP-binding protein